MNGLDLFLEKFCTSPETINSAFQRMGLAERQEWILDGGFLCHKNDKADCFWVICSGEIRVRTDIGIVTRQPGDIVGEQAFFRKATCRGADLVALGTAKVLKIDASLILKMEQAEQAVWYETLARALSAKLDQATCQRTELHAENRDYDGLIDRFVCREGRQAALSAIHAQTSSITGENVNAVIWFSDIAGFSSYAESLSETEVATLIRSIMDIQTDEIHASHGQIDKFMGDGLMAFWRAPNGERMKDACLNAVMAAVRIRQRLEELFKNSGCPLDIRIGLHAGPVVLGDFGGGDRIAFTSIGTTVNVASRYEQAGSEKGDPPLGRIRVSPEVFKWLPNDRAREIFAQAPTTIRAKHERLFTAYTSKD